jgi:prepilin-type N-terminal cleavage/methylation domain-containing protein
MKRRAGFSLLEVLVALVVFAIGVTGLLVALGANLRDINYTKDHAQAVRIATREMNNLRRLTYVPDASVEAGEGRFSTDIDVIDIDTADLPGGDSGKESESDAMLPYEIQITVSWSDDVGGEPVHKVKLSGIELFEEG